MARATMATLISRVRQLVNDAGGTPNWSDDQIQTMLDMRRVRANSYELMAEPTYTPTTTQYLTFFAEYGDWETDAVTKNGDYTTVVATTIDTTTGRWTFTTEPNYPIYLTGWTYDIYAAAADLLEQRALQLVGQYDFSADGGSYKRSQLKDGFLALASQYRAMMRPVIVELVRSDMVP